MTMPMGALPLVPRIVDRRIVDPVNAGRGEQHHRLGRRAVLPAPLFASLRLLNA